MFDPPEANKCFLAYGKFDVSFLGRFWSRAACWILEFDIYPPNFGGGSICKLVLIFCVFTHKIPRQILLLLTSC